MKNPHNRESFKAIAQILQRDELFGSNKEGEAEMQKVLSDQVFEEHSDIFISLTDDEKARLTSKIRVLGKYHVQVN